MAKRRNRSGVNLPQETLERARRQAAIERGELPPDEPEAAPEAPVTPPAPKAKVSTADAPTSRPRPAATGTGANPYRTTSASQRRALADAQGRAPRRMSTSGTATRERKTDQLDHEQIAHILANPTRVVTEDELRAQYGYVLADIRNMGLLAVGLIVALVVLAQVLPR
jgi:hypothetical protein